MPSVPATQRAVQLVGSDRLTLATGKGVPAPGPYQIVCRVLVCGLCFSDLKLLKQFSEHARKSEVLSGIDPAVLRELPTYVPGEAPTVPGHEPMVEIAAVGSKVTRVRPGERYFIQADWRWLKTRGSNGALGYNFEGALQEYVLLDERIVISPEGESMLMPASDSTRSLAAYGLVEPWACVENSYQSPERTTLLAGGRMLVVAETTPAPGALTAYIAKYGRPAEIHWVGPGAATQIDGVPVKTAALDTLPEATYDDVLYLGARRATVERIFPTIAVGGLINIVQSGATFGGPVTVPLGRVHYAGVRITGTTTADPGKGLARIPANAEIRPGDRIHIVGAGGPMGVMHVIRNLCQGVPGIHVHGSDLSAERLAALDRLAVPVARARGLHYASGDARGAAGAPSFSYVTVMAPVPAIVAQAIRDTVRGGIVNIFAGIPAGVSGEIDLDGYLAKELYVIGTSGSRMEDMRTVLRKVADGTLDTNVSVAAVSGLDGAVDGIRAVEKQLVPGKILVYPACKGLGLTKLEDLAVSHPEVARHLAGGVWTPAAERALLGEYGA